MNRKERVDLFGASSLILFSALLGLNQVLVKIVNDGMQPIFQAGLRSLCAFPLLLLFCIALKKKLTISDGSLVPGIITGFLFAGEFIFLFLALDLTTVSRASVFFYTMPFWVAIGAHFLIPNEQLTLVRICGLGFAMGGIILALSGNDQPATEWALAGDVMCLLGAAMWAGIALIARLSRLSKSIPEMQLLYQLAVSAPIMLAVAVFVGPLFRDLQMFHLGIFSFQVVVVVAFGFAMWFWLLSIYPASDLASFGFLAPVFGVFFGWLILDDPVGWRLIAALTMVGFGIVLVNRKKRPDAASKNSN